MQLLQEYQPGWAEDFLRLHEVLAEALQPYRLPIEHIGSTAVPGLAAKPIIDIDIALQNGVGLDEVSTRLQQVGYAHHGNQGIEGREVFKRTGGTALHPVLDVVPHHLYVCWPGSTELQRHLMFRDYLRQHAEARLRYQQLKEELAVAAGQDRKRYAQLKETRGAALIRELLQQAGWPG